MSTQADGCGSVLTQQGAGSVLTQHGAESVLTQQGAGCELTQQGDQGLHHIHQMIVYLGRKCGCCSSG